MTRHLKDRYRFIDVHELTTRIFESPEARREAELAAIEEDVSFLVDDLGFDEADALDLVKDLPRFTS
jgi:hypothetical protein